MKKISIFAILMVAVLSLTTSCQKEEQGTPIHKSFDLKMGTFHGDGAKTYLGDFGTDGKYSCWQAGDTVYIGSTTGSAVTVSTSSSRQTAHITGDFIAHNNHFYALATKYAVTACTNGAYTMTIPYVEEYSTTTDGYQEINVPMWASCASDESSLTFNNLFAMIPIELSSDIDADHPIVEYLEILSDKVISGPATVNTNGTLTLTGSAPGASTSDTSGATAPVASHVIRRLSFANHPINLTNTSSEVVYISVPAVTGAKFRFFLGLKDANDNRVSRELSFSAKDFPANNIMPKLPSNKWIPSTDNTALKVQPGALPGLFWTGSKWVRFSTGMVTYLGLNDITNLGANNSSSNSSNYYLRINANQYDFYGNCSDHACNPKDTYMDCNRDVFCWATGTDHQVTRGLNTERIAPWVTGTAHLAQYYREGGDGNQNADLTTCDWGRNPRLCDASLTLLNTNGHAGWRTPTSAEWLNLVNQTNSSKVRITGVPGNRSEVRGLLLVPANFPRSYYGSNNNASLALSGGRTVQFGNWTIGWTSTTQITYAEFKAMEAQGVVFLPACGWLKETKDLWEAYDKYYANSNETGLYWSATHKSGGNDETRAYDITISDGHVYRMSHHQRDEHHAVRLIIDAE